MNRKRTAASSFLAAKQKSRASGKLGHWICAGGRLVSHSIADCVEKKIYTMSTFHLAFGDLAFAGQHTELLDLR